MLAKVKPLIPTGIRRRVFKRNHVNELPIELLVEIFLCCLPARTFPRPSRHEAPLLLGRVCSVWRSTSLHTPQLWAQITLEDLKWFPHRALNAWNSETFHRFGIHEWLRRSGNCPLSFKIGQHCHEHIFAPLLTLTLQAEAHRWKAVSLNDTCRCIEHILEMLWSPGKTPMLTDLRFLTSGLSADPPENTTPQAIPCVSQLSTFHLHSKNVIQILGSGAFYALRELRICLFENSSLLYSLMLTQFPLLEILELTFRSPLGPLSEPVTVAHTLQYLHTFIFVDMMDEYAHLWLLGMFDTPVLNSLAITTPGDGEATHLSDFLLRCGGQLKRLMLLLSVGKKSFSGFVGFTQHTPVLETLCTACGSALGLVDLATSPTLSQIHIMTGYGEYTMNTVLSILSQWKASRLKERATAISPFILGIRRECLSQILKHQEVKKCIRKGLRVEPLPPDEESWWKSEYSTW